MIFGSTIADCSENLQTETWSLFNQCKFIVTLYMAFKHSIPFATDLATNLGPDLRLYRIMPEIVSKLFLNESALPTEVEWISMAIWSCCAVQLESERTPFSQTGHQFRSATVTLHRIWSATCGSVPMPYFCLETVQWSKEWATQWAQLW